jgi:uncharacterized protein (TIGR01777 family)
MYSHAWKVLLTGASGLIGSALRPSLQVEGCELWRLTRRKPLERQIAWDPARPLDPEAVSGFDAVIHVAGENIAGLWTAAKKRRILQSRVVGTRNLSEALAKTPQPPTVLVAASAIGYYGDRDDEILNEESSAGSGFLPEVCQQWEAAAQPAKDAGIRTVHIRTGLVLSQEGGALAKMLPVFRMGLGGQVGSGRQWWSWIHIEDLVAAVLYLLRDESLCGPVNFVAPSPVTNGEFTKTLSARLHRPAFFSVPAVAARLALGRAADELLLASARVEPARLAQAGFCFRHPTLGEALASILGG